MKVFLVDDDIIFHDFLKEHFPAVQIEHFKDWGSLYEKILEDKPDKIIVDLNFEKTPYHKLLSKTPELEGLVIAKRLQELYPELPILLASRFIDIDVKLELRRLNIPYIEGFADLSKTKEKLKDFFYCGKYVKK